MVGNDDAPAVEYDSGTAARYFATFFYAPKASRTERERGCEAIPESPINWSTGTQNPGSFQSPNTHRAARNSHPTVKNLSLMSWLCRLVTPPGGLVLDPFAGSGSTLIAAKLEGFSYLGIEREEAYVRIAEARLAAYEAPVATPSTVAAPPTAVATGKPKTASRRAKRATTPQRQQGPTLWEVVI